MRPRVAVLTVLVVALMLGAAAPARAGEPFFAETRLKANPAIVEISPLTLYFPNLSAKLTAALPQSQGGGVSFVPVQGQKIAFYVRLLGRGAPVKVCEDNTNAQGVAACGGVVPEVRTILGFGYYAVFAGSIRPPLEPAVDRGPLIAA